MRAEHSLFFLVRMRQSFATRIDPDLRPLPYIPIISGLFVLFDQPYAITLKISSADIPHLRFTSTFMAFKVLELTQNHEEEYKSHHRAHSGACQYQFLIFSNQNH